MLQTELYYKEKCNSVICERGKSHVRWVGKLYLSDDYLLSGILETLSWITVFITDLFPHVTKIGTGAQGVEVTCI